ncbi:hypothetical protein DVH05_020466 [Phytophthora capsici]|nr:hypothetical protein DVH05_020466 [Phytophthora capsici]
MTCAAHSLHLVVAAALMQKSGDKLDETIPGGSGVASTTDGDDRIGDDFELVGGTLDSIAFDSISETSWLNVQITDHEVTIDSTVGERLDTEDDFDNEYVCEAEVAALCEQVVQFVETAARSASQDVNTADLESVRKAVRQFRKLAEYFHRSSTGANRMNELQHRSKSLNIKIDCPTRWNSTLDMLLRFGELHTTVVEFFRYLKSPEGIEEFSDVSTKKLIPPPADEWFVIQCLVELLAPFQTVTKYLNAEVYPTFVALQLSIRTLQDLLSNDRMFDVVSASVHHEWFCERVLAKMHSVRLSFIRLLNQGFKEVMDPELLWISFLDPYLATTYFLTPEETKVAKKNMLN